MNKIEKLVNSQNASLKLSPIASLRRNTVNALGEKCDGLFLEISIISSPDALVPIQSRTSAGIIDEVNAATAVIFSRLSEELARKLKNGYISDDVKCC